MSVRTRFAPSPTGYLHIGGVRTALFSWLLARRHGGQFLLRVEDTDRERSTQAATDAILDGLTWLGLGCDEGPFFQSQRFDLYRRLADELLLQGHVYRCWCTTEELDARRAARTQAGQQPAYDRRCRDLTTAPAGRKAHTLRLRMPTDGETVIDDLVKGPIVWQNAELDDFIIARTDGSPVYNFCVVCDDVDMRITHVVRGDDHIANTARQIHIYRALGATLPRFAHLPLILGIDKTRLSKRHGAMSVTAYRDQGYLPEAVINYLARLGWAHGDQELFSRAELVAAFGLEAVSRSAGVFNPEKLEWVNFQHLKATPPEELAGLVLPFLPAAGLPIPSDSTLLPRLCRMLRERSKTLVELAAQMRCYLLDDITYDDKAVAKFLTEAARGPLTTLTAALGALPTWSHDAIDAVFQHTLATHALAMGKLAQPVRVAVTGGTISPGIHDVLEALGQSRTLTRLTRALQRIP
jgi:glutamyl-tRNA synthetase